ncbi:hypothetical protein ATN89_17455 [Comamonas thiooxydans]|uniref:tape measure protein n=1 Tax=Comamonas thiooxydans TaxID=363952 RepID=UPI0007C4F591|nr:tape measure protein [Comamonas thiooxydans]OAD82869.1 hypothetical protein ATN89_17455 [Comamonas thiooxydans]
MGDSDIKIRLELDDDGYKVIAQKVTDSLKKMKGEFEQVSPAAKKAETSIKSVTHRFRDFVLVTGTMRFALLNLYDAFGRLPMHIMKNAGELERMQALMAGLSKETEKMAKAAEGIRDFNFITQMAKSAPFEISALSDSFVKLKTAGIDPTNGSLQTLVDSVARFGGTSEVLKRASVAISQMAGKGVVSMEELRQQLGEAIPNAMQAMATGLGMSMAELTKAVSKGTLVAKTAIAAMMRELKVQNDGAAAEMMTTWVGMTAQLKTQWMLASKDIADSGFGDAMKSAVKELTTMLASPEFREFGRNFGSGLGEAIGVMKDLGKVIYDNAEYIKIAALAWAAYKVQTSLVGGAVGAVGSKFKELSQAAAESTRTIADNGKMNVARARDAANATLNEIAESKRAAVEKIAVVRNENATINQLQQQRMDSYSQMRATILAHDTRMANLQASLADATSKKQVNSINRQIGQLSNASREIDKMRLEAGKLSQTIVQQTQVMNTNDRTVGALVNTIQRAERATAAKTAALGRSIIALNAQTFAMKAATVAGNAFGSVLNAMGGWVGVAITAIGLLVAKWYDVKRAAEAAAQAQRRAADGHSTASERDAQGEQVDRLKKELEELKSDKVEIYDPASGQSITLNKDKKQLGDEKAVIEQKTAELNRAMKVYNQMVANISRDKAGDEVAFYMREQADQFVNEMQLSTKKRIDAVDQAAEAERKKFKDGSKEQAAALKKFTEQRYKISSEGYAQQAEHWKKQEDTLTAQLQKSTGQDAVNLQAKLDEVKKLGAQARELRDQMSATILPETLADDKAGKKKGNGPAVSAWEKLVSDVKGDRLRLDEELDNVLETGKKGISVADVINDLETKFKEGAFKKDKVTRSMLDGLIEQIKANAAKEQDIKDAQTMARKAEHAARYIESLAPEFEQAMEVISDPMGVSTSTQRMNSVAKQLLAHADLYEAYAKKTGQTFADVVANIKSQAATIDIANAMRNLVSETQQLSGRLTNETRIQRQERITGENDAHAREMQNLYDRVAAEGAAANQLAALQDAIFKNNRARALAMVDQVKPPLQKLAEEWGHFSDNLEQSTAGWAQTASDAFLEFATTGKSSIKDMVSSILKDLARLYTNKAFSVLIQMGMSAVGSWMSGGAGTGPLGSGSKVDYSLGSGSSGLGLKLPTTPFADGGIMTELGSVPLRKYAKGGIADSPQLALYGEGKYSEAYVPLPDGRSIPVTMSGGGQGIVNNIHITINDSGKESTTGSSAGGTNDAFARGLANRVKDVVREELMNQKRQGGILAS